MKKVLVLGASGMLGAMVAEVLGCEENISLHITLRGKNDTIEKLNLPTWELNAMHDIEIQLEKIYNAGFSPDFVINCIGIIKPYCKDDDPKGKYQSVKVNALFPHELAGYFKKKNPSAKIIQIATDCVYKGDTGYYNETHHHDPVDVYGKSKSLGEVLGDNFLNIRCSIIGPELTNHLSLMDWFLSQPRESEVLGFDHHLWNGVTTLQFAQLCKKIIADETFDDLRKLNHTLHYVINEDVTKYSLLNIFKKVFSHDVSITKTNTHGEAINRTLRSSYLRNSLMPMEAAITELKEYMNNSSIF